MRTLLQKNSWLLTAVVTAAIGVACANHGMRAMIRSTTSKVGVTMVDPITGLATNTQADVLVSAFQDERTRSVTFPITVTIGDMKTTMMPTSSYESGKMVSGYIEKTDGNYSFSIDALCSSVSCERFALLFDIRTMVNGQETIRQTAILYSWDATSEPQEVKKILDSNFSSVEIALLGLTN